jgi:hypothetical protein
MKESRHNVYFAIDGERDYQDTLAEQRGWPKEGRVPAQSTGDYLVLLKVYIDRAMVAWTDNSGDLAALDVVRKVAGIAVHCMEDNGVVFRKAAK